jgi:alkyl hydroperoxide reductase subunit AhpC
VAAISVDSQPCHAAWCRSLGRIKIPVLSDFNPLGAVSKAYGVWLPEDGMSDRATVVVDPKGRVAYAVSVGKGGRREMHDLLQVARAVGPTLTLTR